MDYKKMAREMVNSFAAEHVGWQKQQDAIAQAIERAALEARLKGIDWCTEQWNSSVVFYELDRLSARIAELKEPRK